jgi:protein TonB
MTRIADFDGRRDRIISAVAVAGFHILLGYLLVTGFGARIVATVSDGLKVFDIVEPPPPPLAVPAKPKAGRIAKARTPKREGAASPRNKMDTPKPVVAPPPVVPIPVPPPIVAAPTAGQGMKAASGASTLPGPGTGSGGVGSGTGSGREGDGPGGGGGGIATPPRWISGRILDADYPRAAVRAHANGTVYMRFVVAPTGRVSDCRVTRSSGREDLDRTTCQLIKERLRYRPARDPAGNPVAYVIRGEQDWQITRRRDDYDDDYPE